MATERNWRWRCIHCGTEGWQVMSKQGEIPTHARPDNRDCRKALAYRVVSRDVTNDDIWAAARGLRMYAKDKSELLAMAAYHSTIDVFASKVIVEAARQVAATKREG